MLESRSNPGPNAGRGTHIGPDCSVLSSIRGLRFGSRTCDRTRRRPFGRRPEPAGRCEPSRRSGRTRPPRRRRRRRTPGPGGASRRRAGGGAPARRRTGSGRRTAPACPRPSAARHGGLERSAGRTDEQRAVADPARGRWRSTGPSNGCRSRWSARGWITATTIARPWRARSPARTGSRHSAARWRGPVGAAGPTSRLSRAAGLGPGAPLISVRDDAGLAARSRA